MVLKHVEQHTWLWHTLCLHNEVCVSLVLKEVKELDDVRVVGMLHLPELLHQIAQTCKLNRHEESRRGRSH